MRVALIDDDAAVLDSLQLYLGSKDVTVACFPEAGAFLSDRKHGARFDCIVADVRMPGMSGLDLVRHLTGENSNVPIVLVTGHGDVDMAVAAVKLGAFDFIEKPFDEARLLQSIHNAVSEKPVEQHSEASLDLQTRAGSLTERQRQVMELAAAGSSNKEIATRLGISPRTVEIHRAWMMEKMGARNLAELVRMAMKVKPNS